MVMVYNISIKKFRTDEMMIEAVKQHGYAINYIDQQFRTYEMMCTVKQNGYALQHIDQEFRTDEIMGIIKHDD